MLVFLPYFKRQKKWISTTGLVGLNVIFLSLMLSVVLGILFAGLEPYITMYLVLLVVFTFCISFHGRLLTFTASMLGLWVVLSGVFQTFTTYCLIISTFSTIALYYKLFNDTQSFKITVKGVRFCLLMIKNMCTSSIQTLWVVLQNKEVSLIKEISFANLTSNTVATLHAAAITMTPGTAVLFIDQDKGTMLIHSISKNMIDLPDEKISKLIK